MPEPPIDRPQLDAQLIWTLVRAAHRVERRLTEDLGDLDLSPIQFGVLSQLSIETSATNAQLARLCFVRPQTMAGVVDGMVARGLIRREGPGGRGRPAQIVFTDDGTALFARSWPAFLEANAGVTAEVDPDEVRRINDALHRIAPVDK